MEGHIGQEPSQIALIVHGARNLHNKKRAQGEVCHASVVFGLGKELYKTLTVESNDPQWKEEAIVNVPPKVHNGVLKFRVRDQDHALGAVHLNIPELTKPSSKQWYPIHPSKKSQESVGELLLEYSVKEYRPCDLKHSPAVSHSTSQEDVSASKSAGGVGGASASGGVGGRGRFSFHHRTSSFTKVRSSSSSVGSERSHSTSHTPPGDLSPSPTHDKRLTGSDAELHSKSSLITYQSDSNLRGYSLYDTSSDKSPEQTSGILDGEEREKKKNPLTPEVTGISPREGPVEGGQRVVLRGSNLGEFKNDIVKVVIASVDCTSTLEYFSPSKLAVTTSARHTTGSGPVVVETVSGGTGKSSVNFTFTGTEHGQPPEVTGISPREGPVEGDQRVVLRGSNLGESKNDVIKVLIAGVDCTSTLEYYSPAKLVVTTLPRSSPGSGPVVVETERGGLVESSLSFSYITIDASGVPSTSSGGGGVVGGALRLTGVSASSLISSVTESPLLNSKKSKQSELDQAEIKSLKQQVKDLKLENSELQEENKSLKSYIEQLLLNIMDSRPDILEVGKHPEASPHNSNGIVQ